MNVQTIVAKLQNKGEGLLLTGATGSGKTSSLSALAQSPLTELYLRLGEASGKGSLNDKQYIATDHPDIPEEGVVGSADILRPDRSEYGDDSNMFGALLYSYSRALNNPSSNNDPKVNLEKMLINRLKNPPDGNAGLEAKLNFLLDKDGCLTVEARELIDLLCNMTEEQRHVCLGLFRKANERHKGQKQVKVFTNDVIGSPELRDILDGFWALIDKFLEEESKQVIARFEDAGAEFDGNRFYILLTEDIFDEEGALKPLSELNEHEQKLAVAAKLLLHSEKDSVEHLFGNICVCFRGRKELFDLDTTGSLTVLYHNEQPVRVLRLIDTMGLMHRDKDIQIEADRIADMLKRYYCNQLVIMQNSYINSTTKEGYTAIKDFLQKYKSNAKIYIVFTHWDEYLKRFALNNAAAAGTAQKTGRRSRFDSGVEVDWNKMYELAMAAQTELYNDLCKTLGDNPNKGLSICADMFMSCFTGLNAPMENMLRDKGVQYDQMWVKLLPRILADRRALANKVKVSAEFLSEITYVPPKTPVNVAALRSNLDDCIDKTQGEKRLWPATAEALKRHWRDNGNEFQSNVVATYDGYQNIHSMFVSAFRDYARTFLEDYFSQLFAQVTEKKLIAPNDYSKFCDGIRSYFKDYDVFGREFAKAVYVEAVADVNRKSGYNWYYQYQHANCLMRFVYFELFLQNSVVINDRLTELLIETADKCLNNFVDQRCITI